VQLVQGASEAQRALAWESRWAVIFISCKTANIHGIGKGKASFFFLSFLWRCNGMGRVTVYPWEYLCILHHPSMLKLGDINGKSSKVRKSFYIRGNL
jgi:hypothetical protein